MIRDRGENNGGLGLDLVGSPVHVVDLVEVVSSLPDVIQRSPGVVIHGVVVLFSELS